MRPGQNKRMRGRNNRKGPNPLTRTYESNGPDVKIRGTAHHVGEKYLQLARDAQSSGDPVMAENYLQHAEHYFRIIAAAQQAQQQAMAGYMRQPGDPEPEEFDDDDDGGIPDRFASPLEKIQPPYNPQQQPPYPAQAQQASMQQPFAQPSNERQPFPADRPQPDRQPSDRPYQDRGPRPERSFQDRNQNHRNGSNRGPRDQRQNRDFRNDQQPRFEPRVAAPEDENLSPVLPSFITAPVRVSPMEAGAQEPAGHESPAAMHESEGHETGRYHLRNRRRRRPANGEDGASPRSSSEGEG
jgi:hypothetical protein